MGRKGDFHKQLDLLEGLPQWISLMSEWLAVRTGLPEEEEAKEGSSPGPPFNSVELSGSKKGAQGAPQKRPEKAPKKSRKRGFWGGGPKREASFISKALGAPKTAHFKKIAKAVLEHGLALSAKSRFG